MKDCSAQVSKFEADKVRLSGEDRKDMRTRRDNNRSRLKAGLDTAENPKPIGCHSQGSYAMWTMIQDENLDYDIDDGVYFEASDLVGDRGAELSALQVRKMICEAVSDDRFAKQPEPLKNCVRVYYNEGFHVDLPSYRRFGTTDPWSGKTIYRYELASSDWEASDPRQVTKWFNKVNSQMSPDFETTDGQVRRVVRLLKKFSKSRSSWKDKTATGFMITKLVQECYVAANERDDAALRQTATSIVDRLSINTVIGHPVLSQNITRDDDPRPSFFKDKLKENLAALDVLDKSSCTHKQAMSAWDTFFSTDWFGQQPPDDEGGKDGDDPSGQPSAPVVLGGSKRYA